MNHLDPSRPPAERAQVLLELMTIREKTHQLVGVLPHVLRGATGLNEDRVAAALANGVGHISGIGLAAGDAAGIASMANALQRYLVEDTRLGIPAIIHTEALAGIVGKGFTSFPTAIGMAATWNPNLVEAMADVIRRQARGVGIHQALNPVLDVARDARWGRVHETFGEEVLLVTAMGVSFVRGLQGQDLSDGVIATAKHFLGYSMTEGGQNLATTHFGPRELYDVYATPFEAAIRLAKLRSVMNSYSEIDGEPVGASSAVLTDLLRGRLGFEGTVVSDYQTLRYLVERQGVARSAGEIAAMSLVAGLDVELPSSWAYGTALENEVEEGRVSISFLNQAVLRVLHQKFELGLFECPFVKEDPVALRSLARAGRDIAATAARQSLTLVKNDNVLPFDPAVKKIAVIGPHASSAAAVFANYTYPTSLEMMRGLATGEAKMVGMEDMLAQMPESMRKAVEERTAAMRSIDLEQIAHDDYDALTLAEAIQQLLPEAEVTAVSGAGVLDSDPYDIDAAVLAAKDADVVVLALGGRSGAFEGRMTEGEGVDTADINLPARQTELARRVAEVGKPTAAVLFMGRPYGIAAIDEVVHGIVTAYYPGPEGTRALADVLFGRSTPSGKLPFTLPRHSGQVPIYQAHKRGSGDRRLPVDRFHGYADMPSTPLYPFGHGLSYTSFEYGDLTSESTIPVEGSLAVSFDIRNIGSCSGVEVVQLYASTQAIGITRPIQQLIGFSRVELEPGQAARVDMTIETSQLGFSGKDGRFIVEPGPVVLRLGSSSTDIRQETVVDLLGEVTDVSGSRSFLPSTVVQVLDPAPAAGFGQA